MANIEGNVIHFTTFRLQPFGRARHRFFWGSLGVDSFRRQFAEASRGQALRCDGLSPIHACDAGPKAEGTPEFATRTGCCMQHVFPLFSKVARDWQVLRHRIRSPTKSTLWAIMNRSICWGTFPVGQVMFSAASAEIEKADARARASNLSRS